MSIYEQRMMVFTALNDEQMNNKVGVVRTKQSFQGGELLKHKTSTQQKMGSRYSFTLELGIV